MAAPLFVIDGFGYFLALSDPARLARNYARGVRRGIYRGMRVYDSAGNGLVIRDAVRRRIIGGWGWLELNPKIEVSLEVGEELRGVTLEDIKEAIDEAIDAKPDFWDEGEGVTEAKRRHSRFRTMAELVEYYLPLERYW